MKCLLLVFSATLCAAYAPAASRFARRGLVRVKGAHLDMNDPAVAKEFAQVNKLSHASVEYELDELGIPLPTLASEMDAKLMLMEARFRLKQTANKQANKPSKTASTYEKVCFEKPNIRKYADALYDKGDINAYNTFVEYINDKNMAMARYGSVALYKNIFKVAEEMLTAPAFVSKKLEFSGFPAAMGPEMIKMSFKEFGELKAFNVKDADDPMAEELSGSMEYDDVAAAKKCVARYDGADMGMGTSLKLTYVE